MGIGISLAAVLREEDESKLRWRVDGPDSMLPDKQELYEGLEISKGQWHSEFETAAASFRNLFFSVARAHR
jgi:hypothetical protein